MSDEDFFQSVQEVIKNVLDADNNDFHELAKIANLNPTEDFSGGDLSQTRLSNTNLRDYNFSETDLTGADLNRAILTNANFRGANLSQANLSNADLTGVDFSEANLVGANLSRACLRDANLRKSHAQNADFSYAILTGACLEDWDFDKSTQLRGVDCEYVYLLDRQQKRCPAEGFFVVGEFSKLLQNNNILDIPGGEQIQPHKNKNFKPVLSTVNPTVNLGKWLKHEFSESLRFGWQMIGVLLEPEQEQLAFAIRSTARFQEDGIRRTKLIDLGSHAVVLLVALIPQDNQEFQILVQVHPTRDETYVVPSVNLSLIDESEEILQEAHSRNKDNYIQLKRFTCPLNERFSIRIELNNIICIENFEL